MALPSSNLTRIGLAVMGQNLALNIAEKGFPISVYNRTTSKVDETVERAKLEGNQPVYGFHDPASFVNSIQKPCVIIMLVKAGAPVDQTIATLSVYMEKGDCIIDGGNEWYENTERREKAMAELGLLYLGMGVSGGEEGARRGPSLMPGGSFEAYKNIEDILLKVAAQVPDSGPCVTYIGKGGSGNFVKMVHNGIEYDLEWKLIYVGSAEDETYDQLLESVLVGPVNVGNYRFVFQADPPDPTKIREEDIIGVTVLLLTCSYLGQEFIRVGYYVNNDYDDEQLREEPPPRVLIDRVQRNILADKPRVTKFPINFHPEPSESGGQQQPPPPTSPENRVGDEAQIDQLPK